MTLDEVKEFLEQGRDDPGVKDYLATLVKEPGVEAVESFLKTADGVRYIQPIIDQTVSKAIKTRDTAHKAELEAERKRVAAETTLRLQPQEDPTQRRLRELEETVEKERAERDKEMRRRQYVEKAARLGIPAFFSEYVLPASEEEAEVFLKEVDSWRQEVAVRAANEGIASQAPKPGSGNDKRATKPDLANLSFAEAIALEERGELDQAMTQR